MNLYQLESMKIRLSTYVKAILGIFASLLALGILFLFIVSLETRQGSDPKEMELFADWNGLLALIAALTFGCFSVLSAVLAAKVIVHEYCEKNALILFCYSISRRKILDTKCLLVCGITTTSAFINNLLVMGFMYIIACIFKIGVQLTTNYFILTVLFSSILVGILSATIGICSAVIGWKKRSVMSTIICSLIIVCLVTNFITISPKNIVLVMFFMSLIFILIVNMMYHVLAKEIEKMEV